jgi:hypothetical protein
MLRINFAREDTAGLGPEINHLYCLAVEVEPDPDQPPPWEGGPRIEWRFLALTQPTTDEPILIAFTDMHKVVHFNKAGQGHRYLPPSHEIVKVAMASLRQAACHYDILVDPDADELGAMLEAGTFDWHPDGLESLI